MACQVKRINWVWRALVGLAGCRGSCKAGSFAKANCRVFFYGDCAGERHAELTAADLACWLEIRFERRRTLSCRWWRCRCCTGRDISRSG